MFRIYLSCIKPSMIGVNLCIEMYGNQEQGVVFCHATTEYTPAHPDISRVEKGIMKSVQYQIFLDFHKFT